MAREILTNAEVDSLVNEFETKLARLRAIYEQYFLGIERTPPRTQRKDVVRLLNRLEHIHVQNTATSFRIRSLVQRFNSYKVYWNRVERQIEEGTYKRDIRRAARNKQKRDRREERRDNEFLELDLEEIGEIGDLQAELEAMDASGAFDRRPNEPRTPDDSGGLDAAERERRKQNKLAEIAGQLGIEGGGGDEVMTSAPRSNEIRGVPASGSARPTGGNARPATSVADRRQKLAEMKQRMEARGGGAGNSGGDDARRVYDQLLEAKRRCNEPTTGLSYEAVEQSMRKQRESLQQKRGASDVEFKVVIKGGKAFLKPETK